MHLFTHLCINTFLVAVPNRTCVASALMPNRAFSIAESFNSCRIQHKSSIGSKTLLRGTRRHQRTQRRLSSQTRQQRSSLVPYQQPVFSKVFTGLGVGNACLTDNCFNEESKTPKCHFQETILENTGNACQAHLSLDHHPTLRCVSLDIKPVICFQDESLSQVRRYLLLRITLSQCNEKCSAPLHQWPAHPH